VKLNQEKNHIDAPKKASSARDAMVLSSTVFINVTIKFWTLKK